MFDVVKTGTANNDRLIRSRPNYPYLEVSSLSVTEPQLRLLPLTRLRLTIIEPGLMTENFRLLSPPPFIPKSQQSVKFDVGVSRLRFFKCQLQDIFGNLIQK